MTHEPGWQRSSFCSTNACVEVSRTADGRIMLRDSKNMHRDPLTFNRQEWTAFVRGVGAGEFDIV